MTGIGSGVALFAAQMAALVGAKVWVTSSKEEKIQRCKDTIGVIGGFNYTSKVCLLASSSLCSKLGLGACCEEGGRRI